MPAEEAHEVVGKARGYLRLADRLLPGQVTGFYVVGSVALGEYVPGRSDLDFVAIIRDDLAEREERRLRVLHLLAGAQSLATTLAARRSPLTGTRNGVFVRQRDVARPVSEIAPIASHTGVHFAAGKAFDVNPSSGSSSESAASPSGEPSPLRCSSTTSPSSCGSGTSTTWPPTGTVGASRPAADVASGRTACGTGCPGWSPGASSAHPASTAPPPRGR